VEQKTIDLVHSVFCRKPHTHKIGDLSAPREDDICYYYLEGQVEHGENLEDHVEWANEASAVATTLCFTTDKEVIEFIRRLGTIVSNAAMLEVSYPGSRIILERAMRL